MRRPCPLPILGPLLTDRDRVHQPLSLRFASTPRSQALSPPLDLPAPVPPVLDISASLLPIAQLYVRAHSSHSELSPDSISPLPPSVPLPIQGSHATVAWTGITFASLLSLPRPVDMLTTQCSHTTSRPVLRPVDQSGQRLLLPSAHCPCSDRARRDYLIHDLFFLPSRFTLVEQRRGRSCVAGMPIYSTTPGQHCRVDA